MYLLCYSDWSPIAETALFVKSIRGNDQLVVGGYRYSHNTTIGERINWRCSKRTSRRCKAVATTVGDVVVKLSKEKHTH